MWRQTDQIDLARQCRNVEDYEYVEDYCALGAPVEAGGYLGSCNISVVNLLVALVHIASEWFTHTPRTSSWAGDGCRVGPSMYHLFAAAD